MEGPYLVLANHNTNLDVVLIHLSFSKLLYFVASEHVFRMGFVSRLFKRYFDPIPRLKGSSDMGTVREIMGRLGKGLSVAIMAEGTRSFNGLTCPIPASTGKLVKITGVPVITYKFEGGYFTMPRWAFTWRRGRMRGYVVNQYSREQLQGMTAAEVNEAIKKDLFEDAYARQEVERVRFKGRRLAEGLETALFICPRCEGLGTLTSKKDKIFCTCGLVGKYNEFGYLEGLDFTTITQWDLWQLSKLREIVASGGLKPIFEDKSAKLIRIIGAHKSEIIDTGADPLFMYRDRIVCGSKIFLLEDISHLDIYSRSHVVFTHKRENYVISAHRNFCGRKYFELYNILNH